MLVSKNVFVRGHRTSMRLEPEMWSALVEIAAAERLTVHDLVTRISPLRGVNLTSAVRCFVISWYVERCRAAARPERAAAPGRDLMALSFKA